MSVVDGINAFEVVWWIGCGVVVGAKSLRAEPSPRGRAIVHSVPAQLSDLLTTADVARAASAVEAST